MLIFITPRLVNQGQNPFSDRHKNISVKEELEVLREAPALPKKRIRSGQSQFETNIENEPLHDPDPNR